MNRRDQLKRMKYRPIEGYNGDTVTAQEADAATCIARLYGRLDLPSRLYRDWHEQ